VCGRVGWKASRSKSTNYILSIVSKCVRFFFISPVVDSRRAVLLERVRVSVSVSTYSKCCIKREFSGSISGREYWLIILVTLVDIHRQTQTDKEKTHTRKYSLHTHPTSHVHAKAIYTLPV
jgi:hypothetical protein